MVDWQHLLARPIQLKDGNTLLTLEEARTAIEEGEQTRLNAIVVADALRMLDEAAKTGGINETERATERAHVALSMLQLLRPSGL